MIFRGVKLVVVQGIIIVAAYARAKKKGIIADEGEFKMDVAAEGHGLMPGGNWRRGRATQPWATPGQIFGPEQVPMGQKEKQGSSA